MVMQTIRLPAIQDCFVALSTKEHIMTFCGVSNARCRIKRLKSCPEGGQSRFSSVMKVRMPEQEIEWTLYGKDRLRSRSNFLEDRQRLRF